MCWLNIFKNQFVVDHLLKKTTFANILMFFGKNSASSILNHWSTVMSNVWTDEFDFFPTKFILSYSEELLAKFYAKNIW